MDAEHLDEAKGCEIVKVPYSWPIALQMAHSLNIKIHNGILNCLCFFSMFSVL